MIIKGVKNGGGAALARYLINEKDNERVQLVELRGFATSDVVDAFRSVHAEAMATRCEKPFFHVQVRNPAGEHLTRQQWQSVANRIEQELGLTDQPRTIVMHTNDGDEHMHIAWSRIDRETMTARDFPFYKKRMKNLARELEREYGLTRVRNEREPHELRPATPTQNDQARRVGADVATVRRDIREAWENADNGQTFVTALKERGLVLAQGDRRDYLVVYQGDEGCGQIALGKRVLDRSAAEVRARMSDINRDELPTIAAAKEQLRRERAPSPLEKSPAPSEREAHMARTEAVVRALSTGEDWQVYEAQRQNAVLFANSGGDVFAVTSRHRAILNAEQQERLASLMQDVGKGWVPLMTLKQARTQAWGMEQQAALAETVRAGLEKSAVAQDGGDAFAKHLQEHSIALKRDLGDRLHIQVGKHATRLDHFIVDRDQEAHLAALRDIELPKIKSATDRQEAFEAWQQRQWKPARPRFGRSRTGEEGRVSAAAAVPILAGVNTAAKVAVGVLSSAADALTSFGSWRDDAPAKDERAKPDDMARDPLHNVPRTAPIDELTRYELERRPSANPDYNEMLRRYKDAAQKRQEELTAERGPRRDRDRER